MATVVDTLVIQLGLDPTKFTQGQKQAVESFKKTQEAAAQHAKNIEASGQRAAEFFQKLKREALGLTAALIGGAGLKDFVSNVVNTDAAVGRMSRTLNMSGAILSQWRNAAKLWGGTGDDIVSIFDQLNMQLQRFRTYGQAGMIPELRALNIDVTKIKTAEEFFLAINKRLPQVSRDVSGAFAAAFGIDRTTFSTMLSGRVLEFFNRAKELNPVTEEQIRLALELQEAWNKASLAAEGLGRVISTVLLPPLTSAFEHLTKLLSGFSTISREGHFPSEMYGGKPSGTGFADWWKRMTTPKVSGGGTGGAVTTPGASSLLRTKPGSGDMSVGMLALAASLQSDIPGINRFTAFNDTFHAGTSSKHAQGLALDFTLADPTQSAAVAKQIRDKLASMGVGGRVIDEYLHPSSGSTAGHIHVQFFNKSAADRFSSMNPVPTSGAASNVTNRTSTTTSDVKIGNVNVITQATDAQGIARDIRPAIERHGMAAQANSGLE